jgi:predicted molibdopterin-dependent oxidoreductase YjgC
MPIVTIDGFRVEVPQEATVLEAACQAGAWIPTLCCHPALPPLATCRLCMVELDRGDWKQLITACNYPVRRDITVSVNSEAAVRARRGVMQLLLARASGSVELRALAHRMGVETTPFPKVTEAERNCVLCGLCTRVCEEAIGCSAIGFAGRGADRQVVPPFRLAAEHCIACGACAALCPVGTIEMHVDAAKGEVEIIPFKARVKLQVCAGCGEPMLPEPALRRVLNKMGLDWEEFRARLKLCPQCRRKQTAVALALGATSYQDNQS